MSCSCQHSSGFQGAHGHEKHHDCRPAGAFLSGTVTALLVPVLNPGIPVPLAPVAVTRGLRFSPPGDVVSQECGTYIVAANVTALASITIPATTRPTLNVVKSGCRGSEIISSVPFPTLAAGATIKVPDTKVCLQPGDSVHLEIGGSGITLGTGLTFNLVVSKISCCCELNHDCDRCDCPCERCCTTRSRDF